ncbi:YlzJ-like family protein [Natronospora cellulosivora (SeqCode)]
MINYSIYPPEAVFEDYDDYEIEYEEITLNDGVVLQMERINNQELKVSRIISSNPQNYLRTDIQPGTIIKSNLELK